MHLDLSAKILALLMLLMLLLMMLMLLLYAVVWCARVNQGIH